MSTLVSYAGIKEALDNLNIKTGTQKSDFVKAIRAHLSDEEALQATEIIPAEVLIKDIWGTDSPEEIKKRRKSLSSIKSSLNKDLKKLSKDGKNPEGIVVSRDNIFMVSEEQKSALLEKIGSSMSGSDISSLSEMISDLKKNLPDQQKGQAFSDLAKLMNSLEEASQTISSLQSQLETKDEQISDLHSQIQEAGAGAGGEAEGQGNEALEDEESEVVEEEDLEVIEDDESEVVEEDDLEVIEDDETEVVGEDDLEVIEDDELEVVEEDDLEVIEDDGSEIVEEDDLEVIEDDELEVVGEDDLEVIEDDESEVVEEDDLEVIEDDGSEVVGEDDLEVIEDDESDVVEEDDLEVVEGDEGGKNKLLEVLSKYMDPEEVLNDSKEALVESEEGLVAQLLARFTPKFIKIAGGTYPTGSDLNKPDEHPREMQEIQPFYMGQYPVTNDIFELFVRETGYKTEAETAGFGIVHQGRCVSKTDSHTGRATFSLSRISSNKRLEGADWRHPDGPESSVAAKGTHPVVQVSQRDAKAFAAWAGKRLPNEDEWEAAAHGLEPLLFPWGNDWQATLGNFSSSYLGTTTAIDAYPNMSPMGIGDMLGNIYEWTSPFDQGGQSREKKYILKGGCWNSSGVITISHRQISENTWSNIIGFRCAV
jgi:formylglycine-generating enzyme required for sulfatase activity